MFTSTVLGIQMLLISPTKVLEIVEILTSTPVLINSNLQDEARQVAEAELVRTMPRMRLRYSFCRPNNCKNDKYFTITKGSLTVKGS